VASRLREIAPVHRTNRGFWLVSDAASIEQVYRAPTLRIGFDTARREQDPRFALSPSLGMFKRMLPFIDPPDNTRIRKVLAPYFTPARHSRARGGTAGIWSTGCSTGWGTTAAVTWCSISPTISRSRWSAICWTAWARQTRCSAATGPRG